MSQEKNQPKWHGLPISMSQEMLIELDQVVANHPLLNRHRVMKLAYQRGIRDFLADPAKIMEEASGKA
jgi:hypothetical protein